MGGLGVKVQHFPLTLLVVLTTLTLSCERDDIFENIKISFVDIFKFYLCLTSNTLFNNVYPNNSVFIDYYQSFAVNNAKLAVLQFYNLLKLMIINVKKLKQFKTRCKDDMVNSEN